MLSQTLGLARKLLAVALITLAGSAVAAPINTVLYSSLTVGGLEDFETLAAGPLPGTNYDAIVDLDGTAYAERFAGQTLGTSGDFDTLSGTPTGSLSLVAGAANQNLVAADLGGVGITGLGPLGYPLDGANGEGAFSILLDVDSAEFGIEIRGGNGGSATLRFFRRDGTLIDTVTLPGLTDGLYGFAREAAVADIAGISITNDDPNGVGYDNVRFHQTQVPEPARGTLAALALAAVWARAGRRTHGVNGLRG